MGLPVPVHSQLSYPVSLVNVTHRESKYAAFTYVEKLRGELKKEFVLLGEVKENVSRKYSVFVRAVLAFCVKAQHCSWDSRLLYQEVEFNNK